MEFFRPRWVSMEENIKLQQRIQELETENTRLKNHHELIKELTNLLLNHRGYQANNINSEGTGTLVQVLELVKDLSNDIKKMFKN